MKSFDISEKNIVELYLTHYKNNVIKRNILPLEDILSFETLITNDAEHTKYKLAYFKGTKKPIKISILKINNDIAITAYPLEGELLNNNKASFIIGENKYSKAIQLFSTFTKTDLYSPINRNFLGMKKSNRDEAQIKFYYETILASKTFSQDFKIAVRKDVKTSRKELREIFRKLKFQKNQTTQEVFKKNIEK